ncbi:MAG: ribosome recycling factor [Candidatus Magasanikbacteria bacterium]
MNINDFKGDFVKVVDFLKQDIAGLRTGRASSAMVESIMVEAYGIHQSLKAVASIVVQDAKTLILEPWDKTILAAVEKGIRDSGLGINPQNDGRIIRLTMPDLTSERRVELIKVLHQKLEAARVSIRKVREEAKEMAIMEEKEKSIGEDEKFKLLDDLEKMVKDFNDKIKEIGEQKEEEIHTV